MIKVNYKEALDLTVGAGGRAMYRLLDQLILKEFANVYLDQQSDQAILPAIDGKLAFSTDSYVVAPYFFNGGDIGSLAINGTINDLAVSGAKPIYLSVGFILEEGLPLADLRTIVQSMARAADAAGVLIVTGDTKVVERGKGDGVFINTSGIGVIDSSIRIKAEFQVGDKVIINGSIGDHGMAVLAKRQGMGFSSNIQSDCAALHGLIQKVLSACPAVRCMRDPTRGGVSATLHEWVNYHHLGINLQEGAILVKDAVRGFCELLGLDPLHVANEGKVLLISSNADAPRVLQAMHTHPLGVDARIIGEVQSLDEEFVTLSTTFGGVRRIEWLNGEQLPRIC